MHTSLAVEHGTNLRAFNTFGLPCTAQSLVRITCDADVRRVLDDPNLGTAPKFILGGGSNLVLTQDLKACVMKVEVKGQANHGTTRCSGASTTTCPAWKTWA